MSTVFTRYLYNKQEVAVALLTSILQKKRQQSLFWAYELYYSGFEQELFAFLWKIYDQFFCMTNPNFRKYFLKKEKEKEKEREKTKEGEEETKNKDTIVADIVQNLVNRTFTFDVFLLIQMVTQFEIDVDENQDLSLLLREKEKENQFLHIANYIVNKSTNIQETSNIIFQHFKQKEKEKEKQIPQSKEHLVAITMSLFSSHENKTNESKIYIKTKEESIKIFQTLQVSPSLKNYRLLSKAYQYAIDEDHMQSLFSSNRDPDLREKYYYHWEYYASFSPVWQKRIETYKGRVNHETKKVEFEDEEEEDFFYHQYNYEPDEQSKETQEKSIGPFLKKRTWLKMYNAFEKEKRKGLFVPDVDYLEELDVVIFNMS